MGLKVRGAAPPVAAFFAFLIALSPRVLNDYGFGGFLIGQYLSPFIDSRADLYGDAYLDAYAQITRPDRRALAAALEARQIGWTLFRAGSPVAETMDAMPGWWRRLLKPGRR